MSVARFEGDPEVEYQRLLVRARAMTHVAGLKVEIKDNPEAIVAIMWTLADYGLRPTIYSVNKAFDWIEGTPEPSTFLYQALARKHYWDLNAPDRECTRERAVVHAKYLGRGPGWAPFDITFDLADATAAHRLDEWVERWPQRRTDGTQPPPERIVVRVNGEGQTVPEWAATIVEREPWKIKRYTAWWDWRKDMLKKSAVKRAARTAIPHILLGGTDVDFAWSPPPGVREATAEQETIDVDGEDVDPERNEPLTEAVRRARATDADDDPGRPFE